MLSLSYTMNLALLNNISNFLFQRNWFKVSYAPNLTFLRLLITLSGSLGVMPSPCVWDSHSSVFGNSSLRDLVICHVNGGLHPEFPALLAYQQAIAPTQPGQRMERKQPLSSTHFWYIIGLVLASHQGHSRGVPTSRGGQGGKHEPGSAERDGAGPGLWTRANC